MSHFLPVIILVGGLGTRVGGLYPNIPKALIPIGDEPFIAHQLRLLARESVKHVILCVGHRSEQIKTFVGDGTHYGIKIEYSYDGDTLLGTGGAVLKATQMIKGEFAVLYGDSYLDTKYAPLKEFFLKESRLGLMTVFKNNNQWDKSNVCLQGNLVTAYDKNNLHLNMQFIDYGLSLFSPEAFADFATNDAFDLKRVFSTLISKRQLAAFQVKERFYEVGSAAGIEELKIHLKQV